MPRNLVRYQKCGVFHCITFSCYRRKQLLNSASACRVFERELESVRQRYGFVVAGYVLMPEHVHLLLGEPRVASLSTAIQVLKQQTSRNLKAKSDTQFWQRRYYDFNVHNEEKLVSHPCAMKPAQGWNPANRHEKRQCPPMRPTVTSGYS
jgi:putative transposase